MAGIIKRFFSSKPPIFAGLKRVGKVLTSFLLS